MTDIVLTPDENRTLTVLRNEAEAARNGTMVVDGPDIEMAELLDDAADEIEHLRNFCLRALAEIDTWKAVFPDIVPARLKPDRSLLEAEIERLRANTKQERLLGFESGVCSVHDQALHEGRDNIATWIANRYPTATKRISASPTDHNAHGQADANPSQCPRPENE